MKKLTTFIMSLFLLAIIFPSSLNAAPKRVLFDNTHAQTAGNASWIIEGGYSDMGDMLKENGYKLDNLSAVSPGKVFTHELVKTYDAIVLPEPNDPYSKSEIEALVNYVKNGGGLFIISDHHNADRNGNGWDAVRIFNEFVPEFGFKFMQNTVYEAPVTGKINTSHPAMYGFRAVGIWAGATMEILSAPNTKVTGLVDSRIAKAPYMLVSEYHKGRVFAIGDSSPFDDGTGDGTKGKLHDSYDSFMYSHPQIAYNAVTWITGENPSKRIPSRKVSFFNEAKASEKKINILVDAAHGNASSDKMPTFERHMNKMGLKVYYSLNLIKPETLKNFNTLIIPDPSLKILDSEVAAISDWFMSGGNLFLACAWDSDRLRGTQTLNNLLTKIGAVMRFNDDQIHDPKNKTNKPWGVIAFNFKENHPVTNGLKKAIFWGSCSLINRKNQPLKESDGVEILVKGGKDTFNKDGFPKIPAVMYEKGSGIPMMAMEKIVNGTLVLSGCCNFTDYQYPDSDINMAQPGPNPFIHETPQLYDNLMKFLATSKKR